MTEIDVEPVQLNSCRVDSSIRYEYLSLDFVAGSFELADTHVSVESSEILFRQTFLDHVRSEVEKRRYVALSGLSRKTVIEELGMQFAIVGRDVGRSYPGNLNVSSMSRHLVIHERTIRRYREEDSEGGRGSDELERGGEFRSLCEEEFASFVQLEHRSLN